MADAHVETFRLVSSEAAVVSDIRKLLAQIERRGGEANRVEKQRLRSLKDHLAVIRKQGEAR